MKKIISKGSAVIISTAMFMTSLAGCSNNNEKIDKSGGELSLPPLTEEISMESINLGLEISKSNFAWGYKELEYTNPISPNVFCADPTGVEYNGRYYLYGTNDHQQYEAVGNDGKNSYDKIRSMVVFSTDDMVNWVYHGTIDIGAIAPWTYASWAPSIVSRVEDDGLTHFYMYFSNSGAGVGVITSTDPVTGWTDPLGKPLIYHGMEGLTNCPNPFDPGAVIDENGVGWLSFGAGIAPIGTNYRTRSARIVRLGDDMISLDSEMVEIPSYYAFEASELNYVNGTYIYTYNTNWDARDIWEEKTDPPSACSMAYMTTKTPLDTSSWEYRGHYFLNPGESGLNYSNNHTHIDKYKGDWYIFYHTLTLQERTETDGGFRSLCVDKLNLNEKNLEIELMGGTREGVGQIKSFDPFIAHSGAEMSNCGGTWYEESENGMCSVSTTDNAWIKISGADFKSSPSEFIANVKGKGRLEIRLDSRKNDAVAYVEFDNAEYSAVKAVVSEKISGDHDFFIMLSNEGIAVDSWQFN